MILGGLVLVSVAVFVLVALETTVVGPGMFVRCGSALVSAPGSGEVCGPALAELWLVGGGLAIAGLAALISGFLVRLLTPRPLSF